MGQVIVGLSQEPTIFNPLKSTLEVDRGVQFALFDSLWRIDQDAVLVPNLATEIPSVENGGISEDGLTYTFHVCVMTPSGTTESRLPPPTSSSATTRSSTRTSCAGTRIGHDQVTEISAPDDKTVTMTLKEPYAPFLIVWADTYLVPEHLLKDVADLNTAEFNSTAPVGTGPFTFGRARSPATTSRCSANLDLPRARTVPRYRHLQVHSGSDGALHPVQDRRHRRDRLAVDHGRPL